MVRPIFAYDQRRRKHKNLGGGGGGTGVVFARAPGLRKYKVPRATPQKADERGGGGDSHPFFSGQFPDIIYIIG